jgi:hypothetical protein
VEAKIISNIFPENVFSFIDLPRKGNIIISTRGSEQRKTKRQTKGRTMNATITTIKTSYHNNEWIAVALVTKGKQQMACSETGRTEQEAIEGVKRKVK